MKKYNKLLSLLLIVILSFVFTSCSAFSAASQNVSSGNRALHKAEAGTLAVHFLDVGQGDSEFIEFPNGETMLIDAGEAEMGSTVVSDIQAIGYSEITYLVATHPHSDHIGGLSDVLYAFDVENVYLPDAVSASKTYSLFLDAVEAEDCTVVKAESGVSVIRENGLSAEFIAPCRASYDDLNNYSAVLKIVFGDHSFLFMGDAEALVEKEITADVCADVIKVGHHGSNTSSTENFIQKVSPQYAVFECGKDNKYGHPHSEIVERWQAVGASVLRTDEMGDILIASNGSALEVSAESILINQGTVSQSSTKSESENPSEASGYKWVLNTNSKKIHTPDCSSVSKITVSNKTESNESLKELEEQGYTRCKSCNPSE